MAYLLNIDNNKIYYNLTCNFIKKSFQLSVIIGWNLFKDNLNLSAWGIKSSLILAINFKISH